MKRILNALWRHRSWLLWVVVFGTAGYILAVAQSTPGFADADSYYHGRIAQLIWETRHVVRDYPWLRFMFYNDHYVDGHLGYHILLAPFVGLLGIDLGMRISAVIFALLALLTIALVLHYYKTPAAAWLTWLAILTYPFMYRLTLARAPAPGLIFVLPLTIFIIEQRFWPTLLLSFGFAWFYHSWPVIIVIAACALAARFLMVVPKKPAGRPWAAFGRQIITTLLALLGIVLSYPLSPYWPINVRFSLLDIWQIGFTNNRSLIKVGGEWYPLAANSFNQALVIPFCIVVACLLIFLLAKKRHLHDLVAKTGTTRQATLLTFGLLVLGFTIQTLQSQRYFEYLIPFIVIWCGLLLALVQPFGVELIKIILHDRPKLRHRLITKIMLVIIVVMIPVWFQPQITSSAVQSHPQEYTTVQPALHKLAALIPANSVVFHNRWDDGPTFAVAEPSLRYLIGLDPTFFAAYNRSLYDLWLRLNNGQETDLSLIHTQFEANGVVMRAITSGDLAGNALVRNLDSSTIWKKVYDTVDTKAYVYQPGY